jgi:hypothetical protein
MFYILYNFDFFLNIFLVIYDKLLLLNMEIIFNICVVFFNSFNMNNFINNINIMNINITFIDDKWFSEETDSNNIKEFYELNSSWFESFNYIDIINNFFCSFYIWFLIPLFLCIVLIYFLHSIGGLYSAYVDYFQKNPDHFNSYRAFIPAFFFFFFLIFCSF